VPAGANTTLAPQRLEMLADVRVLRLDVVDRQVAFAAPDFFGFLRLRQALMTDAGLHGRICIVPPAALRALVIEAASEALIDSARQNLTRHWPFAAAQLDLVEPVRWAFAVGLIVLTLIILLAPLSGQLWPIPLWMAFMLLPTAMRLAALASPHLSRAPIRRVPDAHLPHYSVMVPLRDEANMVDQLCAHLGRLDYPREKLDILFVVESRSPETVAAVERHLHDPRFNLVVVPDATPRTKPKALDFALPFCRGEFVVVFDAEDRPDADQLRSVVAQFRRQADVDCIQACLTIDNAGEGLLPALFAGEYAGLFRVFLPALARWGAVMPLGGTSNHFRLEALRRLGGWDAYNVTEDADLGVRLARRGMRTATNSSRTLEAAPRSLHTWLCQRRRWMKGWMQTFIVHNRRPHLLLKDLGLLRFVLFELTILGMLLAPLLHIGMWPMFIWLAYDASTGLAEPSAWWAACGFALVLGHGTPIVMSMAGLARGRYRRFWVHQLMLPVYWVLIAWATVLALADLVKRPFHWFKTPHEVTVANAPGLDLAAKALAE
jgi:glycosyltransferase XagB